VNRHVVDRETKSETGHELVAAVSGLRFRYPGASAKEEGHWLLDIGSLHIHTNSAYSLLGENMVGKTTLVRVLTGTLDAPSRGYLEGSFCYGAVTGRFPVDPRIVRRVGICAVHQNDMMFDGLSIWENVLLGAPSRAAVRFHGPAARNSLRLTLARLANHEARSEASALGTLSAGGRAMVRTIRAVAWGYRLLVLDEPTVNLDPKNRDRWFFLLGELWTNPASVVLVSHDPEDHTALRNLALRSGRVYKAFKLHDGMLNECE